MPKNQNYCAALEGVAKNAVAGRPNNAGLFSMAIRNLDPLTVFIDSENQECLRNVMQQNSGKLTSGAFTAFANTITVGMTDGQKQTATSSLNQLAQTILGSDIAPVTVIQCSGGSSAFSYTTVPGTKLSGSECGLTSDILTVLGVCKPSSGIIGAGGACSVDPTIYCKPGPGVNKSGETCVPSAGTPVGFPIEVRVPVGVPETVGVPLEIKVPVGVPETVGVPLEIKVPVGVPKTVGVPLEIKVPVGVPVGIVSSCDQQGLVKDAPVIQLDPITKCVNLRHECAPRTYAPSSYDSTTPLILTDSHSVIVAYATQYICLPCMPGTFMASDKTCKPCVLSSSSIPYQGHPNTFDRYCGGKDMGATMREVSDSTFNGLGCKVNAAGQCCFFQDGHPDYSEICSNSE